MNPPKNPPGGEKEKKSSGKRKEKGAGLMYTQTLFQAGLMSTLIHKEKNK